MDDLEPVPHAWHAAIVRSQLAHARVVGRRDGGARRSTASRGVLTGEDVARLSRPFPGRDRLARAALRGGRRTPPATSASRSPSSSRATATSPRTPPSSSPSTTTRSTPSSTRRAAEPIHDRALPLRRRRRRRSRAPTSSSARRFRVPRFTCLPVECYGVVCDWDEARRPADRVGELPGAVHAARRRRGGARPARRPAAAAHAAGLGRLVRHQGGRAAVRRADRARLARARRPGALDRGPARAPRRELRLDRADHRGRGGLHRGRRARRAALRRARGRRRVRPRARAGDALPDARLALRRLPRAERRRAEPRRAHEHDAVRPQPRLRRAAALLRARADDGDRRPAARARPGRARAPQPRAGRRDAVPHAVRRRSTTRATTRRASTTRSSSRATTSFARPRRARRGRRGGWRGSVSRASSSRRSRTWATSRSRRRRSSARRALPKSGNAEGASVAIDPLGGITVRLATTPQGQGHRTVVRPGRRRRARLRPGGRHRPVRARHRDDAVDGRVGELLVALLGRRRRAPCRQLRASVREKVDAIRAHLGEPEAVAAAGRGHGALEPRGAAGRHGARPRGGRVLRAAEPRPARRRGPRRLLRRRTASSSTSAPSRSTAATGAVTVLDYVTVHDAGTLLNPLLADGQVLGGFAHGVGAALFERHVYDEDGNLDDRLARRLPHADRARHPGAPDRPPRVAVAVHGARREGARRGEHDAAPVAIANAVADALGRDDVELPLTAAARLGAAPRSGGRREAGALRLRPGRVARGGARRARGGRRGREADRGRAEPRPGAQHAARPADAARRPRTAPGSTAIDANGSLRVGATTRQAALADDDRVPPAACARRCRTSATS